MKTLLLTSLMLLSGSALAGSDCFMEYNQVCGQTADGETRVFANKCDFSDAEAKRMDWKACQDDAQRAPASAQQDLFQEVQQIEVEMNSYLAEEQA